jgi:alpha-glucosidase
MTGIHRYAQTWSGDNRTAWKTIRYNAKMGLGLALCGISNSGHDVGGFAGPAPEPELFLRWLQAGILMPRFSIHSWNDDGSVNEPWMYPELLAPVRRLMALRQRLIPYLYDLLWRYHSQYEPVVRPTWLDFPTDPGAWVDGDDHLLGRDLLVALICDPAVTVRTVRPPAGTDWIDVWTGMRMAGGVEVSVNAPLEGSPLLFARSGSAIPIDLARGGFRPEPFRRGLWMFPHAAEGEFAWSFYEDDGEGRGPYDIWRGSCRSSAEKITVSVRRDGPGTFGDDRLTILLPPGETRMLIVEGGNAQPIEFEGRRAVTLALG